MPRKGSYSPALRSDLVKRLYFAAKDQRAPMTVLNDRIAELPLLSSEVLLPICPGELTKPATAALFVGKAVRAALQQWSTARWRGQPHDAETIKAGFLLNWVTSQEEESVRWKADEDAEQEKARGLVEMYLRETPNPAEEKPEAVEVRVEADLAEHGLPTLLGFIELVRPGGRIVDFKTSAATPQAEQSIHRNETQLTAYGLLYRGPREKRSPASSFIIW